MTENKNGKVDPVAIRELISQGIPMKRKESEIKHSQSEELCVESERPNDEPMSKDFSRVPRRERRKADKVAFHLSQHFEKSQDHLYRQRVAGHVGGDSHVDEKQRYDHWHLCRKHHPASS